MMSTTLTTKYTVMLVNTANSFASMNNAFYLSLISLFFIAFIDYIDKRFK